jgi:hypothetical protein
LKPIHPSHLANPLLGLEKVDELLQLEEVGLVAAEERRLVLVQAQRVLLQLLRPALQLRVQDPVPRRHVLLRQKVSKFSCCCSFVLKSTMVNMVLIWYVFSSDVDPVDPQFKGLLDPNP